MLHAVAGNEGNPSPANVAHRDRGRGAPERSVDVNLLDVLQKRVEARAAEYADLRRRAQAVFPLASPEDFFWSPFAPSAFFGSPPEEASDAGFDARLSVR